LDQIKSLAIVRKRLYCRAPLAAEDKKPACEGIGFEHLFADPDQPIDAVTEVNRFDGDYNAHVRCDLNHRFAPQNTRVSAAKSGSAVPFTWILIREPLGRSSSMLHSIAAAEGRLGNSMKVGFGSAPHCMRSFKE
jgi:hypothetical protein